MFFTHLFDLPCLIVVLSAVGGSFIACGQNRKQFFRLAAILCLPVGAVGSQIGWVKMLSDMSNPDAFGPASSVATLTIIYAFLLFPILLAMSSRYSSAPLDPDRSVRATQFKLWGGLSFIGMILLAAMFWKSNFLIYIDLGSILCIGLLVAIPTILNGPTQTEETPFLSRCVAARNYSVVASLSGLLIGSAGYLSGLDDPSSIEPSMALVLLTALYSGFIIIGSTLAYQVYTQKEMPNSMMYIMGYMCVVLIGTLINNAIIIRSFVGF